MNRTDLRRVDLNLLVLFEALMSERHVGRAAAKLHMSQSGASYALARLRTLVGDPLFLPHPRGVHPTARALAMSSTVNELLALASRALARDAGFDPAAARHGFTVGATDYASFVVLPDLVSKLRREASGVDLRVRAVDRDTLFHQLDVGHIDVAIALATGRPDRIEATPLFEERLVYVGRRGHPLFSTPLTPKTLAEAPRLLVSPRGDAIGPGDEALAALALKRRIVVTAPHFLVAPFIIQACDLVALFAERIALKFAGIASLDIREAPLDLAPWTLSLLVRRDRAHEAPISWLSDAIVRASGSCQG
jgi:DNA-binding transcriptional LysR family regulator